MTSFITNNSAIFLKLFEKYQINTPLRVAHFLAQLAHESGNFTHKVEQGNKAYFNKYDIAYNPKKAKELGNTNPGDGYKYRGRGLIQLTGKANYRDFSKYCGVDVVKNPDLVANDITLLIESAFWYWTTRKINTYADKNDILSVSRKINGWVKNKLPNGYYDRIEKFKLFSKLDLYTALKKKVKSNNYGFGTNKRGFIWSFINSYKR